jgi:hypothetical protein
MDSSSKVTEKKSPEPKVEAKPEEATQSSEAATATSSTSHEARKESVQKEEGTGSLLVSGP